MRAFRSTFVRTVVTVSAAWLACLPVSHALQVRQDASRFDSVVKHDPSSVVSPIGMRTDEASLNTAIQSSWSAFKEAHGSKWEITVDARSGAPLLVQGQGIPMIPGAGNSLKAGAPVTLDSLAAQLRAFVTGTASLAATADNDELVLNREGSGELTATLWKVTFDRVVAGVPVAGDRYVFYVGNGNLIAFGASRWAPITTSPLPYLSRESALATLRAYMGIGENEKPDLHDAGTLQFVPMAAAGSENDSFAGIVGQGYETALAWRFELEVPGEPGRWVALVDAHEGKVLALEDTVKYAFVKGGAQPISNDGICPDGCEQPNFPMPFANITSGTTQTAGSMGVFSCNGASASTTLNAQYLRINDNCGAINVSTTCDSDLDLKTSAGTDCTVPAGTSPGDTHSTRSAFYHLNRIKEHARAWLPANTWLQAQLTANLNISLTCNANWSSGGASGTVNFYRSGGGCRNTGEIAGVFLHEWGHGMDQNDGGGYDNTSEGYGDISSFMLTHSSCIGRGFVSSNCSGYGNACLNCTGVRDQDWAAHTRNSPQTPANWPGSCPSGSGPCGKAEHCEAQLMGETVWDLAVRDLPASGMDAQTAWQTVDRMWFKTRTGSGGNAYSCGATVSTRSCAATSYMTQFRTVDDDDGNLANGTPHAAAIFAAFNRHLIPCGAAGDASNQSTTSCPALPAPALTAVGSPNQIALSWTPVPGAASYNVLRNDQGCGWGHTLIANVAGTSYTDTNLPNVFPLYYAIQAVGSDTDCLGTLSTCTSAIAGGPHAIYSSNARIGDTCSAGGAGNNDLIYDPGETIQFSVTLRNDGATTLTNVSATLTPTTPGVTMINASSSYGTILSSTNATSSAPHFSAQLPTNLTCGSTVGYTVAITSDQGSWGGSFTQVVGLVTPGSGTALSENFSGGIPASWTVVDGGSGGGAASTWTTANPGGRAFTSPIASPVAIVDSDNAGSTTGITQDEQLITPVMNLSTATSVTLNYDEFFRWFSSNMDEKGDVDVRSSLTGGAWVNVVRNQSGSNPSGATTTGAAHRTVNITAQAAGAADVQLRFHYYNAHFEWWWQVDNVIVTYTTAGTCTLHTCNAAADLAVAKSGPVSGTAGGDLSYTVTVTNSGPGTAGSAQLSDSIPAGTTFQSIAAPAGWTCNTPVPNGTGTITCTNPGMAGGSAAFTIVVRANACIGDGTLVTNTATVSAATSDPDGSNNSASAVTTVSDPGTCSDGDACTLVDSCQGGICVGSSPVSCSASDACHDAGTCNPTTGVCSDPPSADGTPCNDGDACTQTDSCQAGLCTGANPVTCTASDSCHDVGTCDSQTGVCSDPVKPDSSPCSDGDACSQTDTCQSGLCVGSNPVVCTASDACHLAGTCDSLTGVCSNPEADPGTSCDDGDDCTTGDSCTAGSCGGILVGPPGEVASFTFSSPTHREWTTLTVVGPAAVYDVARGAIGEWPVGTGGSETCQVSSTSSTSFDASDDPGDGSGWWYLVRGRSSCGIGTYGYASGGSERVTATCP